MLPEFTYHAKLRIQDRLAGLTTAREIYTAVAKAVSFLTVGENAIKVRDLPQRKTIIGSDGSVSVGNMLVVVVKIHFKGDTGKIVTVELRDNQQPDAKRPRSQKPGYGILTATSRAQPGPTTRLQHDITLASMRWPLPEPCKEQGEPLH